MLELDVTVHRPPFSLQVRANLTERHTGIFGPSGAGKTTLLHALAGLTRPTSGRIVIDGDVLWDGAAGVDVPPHRRRIGVVFQDMRLFPHRSVRGNLRYGGHRSGNGGPDPGTVVDLLELGPLLKRRPASLSGGEQRRVALGRALLSRPRLLLLDEPLTGLDAGRRRQILPFLRRVRDELNVPLLHVTHDLTELLQITDRLVLLDGGRCVGCGRYHDLVHERASLNVIHDLGLVNLLRVDRDGDALQIPGPDTVAIRPEDIALALRPVEGISIRNQIEGRVMRQVEHAGTVLVEVDVAGQPLLVEVTESARRQLGLQPGVTVWCLIKTTAVRHLP